MDRRNFNRLLQCRLNQKDFRSVLLLLTLPSAYANDEFWRLLLHGNGNSSHGDDDRLRVGIVGSVLLGATTPTRSVDDDVATSTAASPSLLDPSQIASQSQALLGPPSTASDVGVGGDYQNGTPVEALDIYVLLSALVSTAAASGAPPSCISPSVSTLCNDVLAALRSGRRCTVDIQRLGHVLLDHAATPPPQQSPKQQVRPAALEAPPAARSEAPAPPQHAADQSQSLSELLDVVDKRVREAENDLQQQEAPIATTSPSKRRRTELLSVASSATPPPPPNAPASFDDFDDVEIIEQTPAAGEPHKRRTRRAFTAAEDRAIIEGAKMFTDSSRFTKIFAYFAGKDTWEPGRTPAQLSDHFRNTLRAKGALY